MALVDDLTAIRDLIQTPATRAPGDGPTALDANGNQVRVNDPAAVRWNLHGAVFKICLTPEARDAVFAALAPATGPSLKEFDAQNSNAAVIGVLSQAIAQAGGGKGGGEAPGEVGASATGKGGGKG